MKRIMEFFKKEKKIALVLGGGGARGIAHLGVLKFLEENGYDFDFIVGTSAGAIFGALYLKTLDIKKTIDEYHKFIEANQEKTTMFKVDSEDKSSILANIKEKFYIAKTIFNEGIFESENMEDSYRDLFLGFENIEELKKPIYIIATDLMTGQDVVFSKGDLITALLATSALPGIFPPVRYKDMYLIDGGPTQKLPVLLAKRLKADKVLAVDVGSKFKFLLKHPTGLKILLRSEEIVSCRLHRLNMMYSDLLLKPNVGNIKWYKFDKFPELLDKGYDEAKLKHKEIDNFFNNSKSKKIKFTFPRDYIFIE